MTLRCRKSILHDLMAGSNILPCRKTFSYGFTREDNVFPKEKDGEQIIYPAEKTSHIVSLDGGGLISNQALDTFSILWIPIL